MGFIGVQPTSAPLTASDITDGIVSNAKLGADSVNAAKISDDSISDEHLDITSITGQTAITSLADTDKFLVSDASDSGNLKYVEKQYLGGGVMTPAFEARRSSSTVVSDDTYERVNYNTEIFDVGGCYDHSTNFRFTPNVAGKYCIYHNLRMSTEANGNFEVMFGAIYKNGSIYASQSLSAYSSNALRDGCVTVVSVIDMNGSSDYVEGWGRIDDNNLSSNPQVVGGTANSRFGGFKIIE